MDRPRGSDRGDDGGTMPNGRRPTAPWLRVEEIAVERIRPEDGLARRRGRDGHKALCRSIEQFGVLTPITVRRAPDGSGDYLLIKGQGRTLACRLLGMKTIPAVIVRDDFADTQKVQQFLVENVARLRMRPIDRALLIAHARRSGEETVDVAKRFGVSPATVRRLEAQMDGATSGEVAALRAGDVNLAMHAVITRHVSADERADIIRIVGRYGIRAREMDTLLAAIGWQALSDLGPQHRGERLHLLSWACEMLAALPRSELRERLRQLALNLPMRFASAENVAEAGQ